MEAESIITPLLAWYGRYKRDLPWRHAPTPYRVWLSEIMLQQTTVPAVIPYFLKFTEKYPDVHALAGAESAQIMHDWAGLGYYSRARNLHACARVVASEYGGHFPETTEALLKLPGIGEYTAGAISAIAFNTPASVVDGNVDRVITRLFALEAPLPQSKPEIRRIAKGIYLSAANTQPAALPQAFMDLGASICTPQAPKCGACPLVRVCRAHASGLAAALPYRAAKAKRPERTGWVYVVKNRKGELLYERRPQKGLLGGMAGLPTTDWQSGKKTPPHSAFFKTPKDTGAKVRHVFTHFGLTLHIATASLEKAPEGHYWAPPDTQGLPTVFAKVLRLLDTA